MKECPACSLCYEDRFNVCPKDGTILSISAPCDTTLSGRYILEKRLGKGGMATVFKAKHKFLKSAHAVKIISPEVVKEDESLLIRFHQEAVLAASIHHPNVVTVTDYGVENNTMPFLVMEFIEGVSLHEYLLREKRITPEQAQEILAQIVYGLSQAHQRGIIHRDLKPLNVMLKNGLPLDKAVKVLDFGLAKIKASESYASLIQAKTTNILGSPLYMSPEQWSNENVDVRADIYSIGVILFQMLAGDVPFKGDSIVNIMYKHLQSPTPTLSSKGVAFSPEIEAVIQKALAKKQEERYSTVEEFLADYERAISKANPGATVNFSADTGAVKNLNYNTASNKASVTGEQNKSQDLDRNFNLDYLTSQQNETLYSFFKQPKSGTASGQSDKLAAEFVQAQNRVEEARNRVDEAEKLAQEFAEAQRTAEVARQKALQAQQKLEEDARRRMQAEMEGKLAAEREARLKAEAEAKRLLEEARARKEAEEKAKASAQVALEAQRRAEDERQKAEKEARQRQIEEQTRRQAEEEARKLAEEAAEAKRKYEEAKKQAEAEAVRRLEAEQKRRKIEEEFKRTEEHEARQKRLAEEKAAQQIKEQAELLEKQALEAERKASEARQLIENEANKRQEAEAARIKAEKEVIKLSEEAAEAKKQYEEAKREAEAETQRRLEAEQKHRNIENEIQRNKEYEAEQKRLAEEKAVQQIREQAARLEKQAQEAQGKANEARQLIEKEAKKRQEAEVARTKAEAEARRLAEEIHKAQKRLEEAEQLAKAEAEKRAAEEEARRKAEESARKSSLANQQNLEDLKKQLKLSKDQLAEKSAANFDRPDLSERPFVTQENDLANTSSAFSNTNQIPKNRIVSPSAIAAGIFVLLLFVGGGGYGIYRLSVVPPSVGTISEPAQSNSGNVQNSPPRLAKMVSITGGTFQLGRNDVKPDLPFYGTQFPAHNVSVSDFYVDRTETSNEEYAEFVAETKYVAPQNWRDNKPIPGQEKYPVTNVSNRDAKEFANWTSTRNGLRCDLPSESEWEYAARSGNQQNIFPWGREWDSGRANIGTGKPSEVGTTGDETIVGGVKDMMGNALEWTSTTFNYYPQFPEASKDPKINSNYFLTIRGASYGSTPDQIKNNQLLLTFRQGVPADAKDRYLGFRLVCRQ